MNTCSFCKKGKKTYSVEVYNTKRSNPQVLHGCKECLEQDRLFCPVHETAHEVKLDPKYRHITLCSQCALMVVKAMPRELKRSLVRLVENEKPMLIAAISKNKNEGHRPIADIHKILHHLSIVAAFQKMSLEQFIASQVSGRVDATLH